MAAYIEEEMRKHPGKSVRAVMLTCAPGGVSQGILTQCAGFTDPAENGFTLCVIVGPPKEVSECVNKFVLNAGAAFVDGVVFRN